MVSKIDRFIFFELNVQEGKYEEQENMFGLFVREGSASFNNLEWRT